MSKKEKVEIPSVKKDESKNSDKLKDRLMRKVLDDSKEYLDQIFEEFVYLNVPNVIQKANCIIKDMQNHEQYLDSNKQEIKDLNNKTLENLNIIEPLLVLLSYNIPEIIMWINFRFPKSEEIESIDVFIKQELKDRLNNLYDLCTTNLSKRLNITILRAKYIKKIERNTTIQEYKNALDIFDLVHSPTPLWLLSTFRYECLNILNFIDINKDKIMKNTSQSPNETNYL